MPNRDISRNVLSVLLLATAAAATTAQTSASLDLDGFDAGEINVHYGATAPAPTSVSVEESDDNSTFAAAPAASVILPEGAHAVSKAARYGYVGSKRYIRIVVTPSAATALTITGILGYPNQRPVNNPA